jgi:hypothetical protein
MLAAVLLARMPGMSCMTALGKLAHVCDDAAGLSLPNETLYRHVPGFLEPGPAVAIQRVFALVALLVALVHHRVSYSVTLGNKTGTLQ